LSVTGDFHVLEQWIRSLDDLGSAASLTEASRSIANEALAQTDQGFEQERNPFGKAWARKKRPDGRKVGQGKTGRLRDTYRIKSATRFGFTIGSDAPYRRFFHAGRKGQKPRQLSPGNRVPPRWDRGFDRIWHAHCLTKLRGR
jgi:phage gpG-like protein